MGAAKGAFVWATVLLAAGCAQSAWQRPPALASAPPPVDYGPNPLADCLHWPADAPRIVPLYAP